MEFNFVPFSVGRRGTALALFCLKNTAIATILQWFDWKNDGDE